MTKDEIESLRRLYEDELLGSVVPFWERHSPDREKGGYFSCLDRDGSVFDTDKFLWMQGRGLWGFSTLCRKVAPEGRWLELARLGADFLREKGRAPNGDFWFSVDREGRPLVQPYNIFSDCFCAAGLAEYGRASGEAWASSSLSRPTAASWSARRGPRASGPSRSRARGPSSRCRCR